MLVLPAEAADAILSRRLQHGNGDGLAVNPTVVARTCWAAMVISVLSSIASTKPSPSVLSARNVGYSRFHMFLRLWTTARSLTRERPPMLAPSSMGWLD